MVLLYDYRGMDSRYSVMRFDTSSVQCTRWTACLCCHVAESITFRGRINRNGTLLLNPLIDACVGMQDAYSTRHKTTTLCAWCDSFNGRPSKGQEAKQTYIDMPRVWRAWAKVSQIKVSKHMRSEHEAKLW